MKNPELVRQHARIKSLIRRASHEPSTKELEMLSHWGRYSCILVSGFLESMVRNIYGDYVKRTASPRVTSFAENQLEQIQNPKAAKLVDVARYFDSVWAKDLEEFLKLNFRADAVNSIISNRHLIAHGRDSQITLARVDQYLGRAVEVATFIEDQCK